MRFSSSNLRRLILLIYRIGPKNDYAYSRSSVSRISPRTGGLGSRERVWAARSPLRVTNLHNFFCVREDYMCSYSASMSCRYPERGSCLPLPARKSENFYFACAAEAVT